MSAVEFRTQYFDTSKNSSLTKELRTIIKHHDSYLKMRREFFKEFGFVRCIEFKGRILFTLKTPGVLPDKSFKFTSVYKTVVTLKGKGLGQERWDAVCLHYDEREVRDHLLGCFGLERHLVECPKSKHWATAHIYEDTYGKLILSIPYLKTDKANLKIRRKVNHIPLARHDEDSVNKFHLNSVARTL